MQGLRLIGEQRIAHGLTFQHTTVGGLSGIDYDPRSGQWIIASDDRSDYSAARFYTARLEYDAQAFTSVRLTGVTFLQRPNGRRYASRWLGNESLDMESIRYDPDSNDI